MKSFSVRQAKQRFGDIIRAAGDGPVAITRYKDKIAVVMTPGDFRVLLAACDLAVAAAPRRSARAQTINLWGVMLGLVPSISGVSRHGLRSPGPSCGLDPGRSGFGRAGGTSPMMTSTAVGAPEAGGAGCTAVRMQGHSGLSVRDPGFGSGIVEQHGFYPIPESRSSRPEIEAKLTAPRIIRQPCLAGFLSTPTTMIEPKRY